jgi:hypothetical protein
LAVELEADKIEGRMWVRICETVEAIVKEEFEAVLWG